MFMINHKGDQFGFVSILCINSCHLLLLQTIVVYYLNPLHKMAISMKAQ